MDIECPAVRLSPILISCFNRCEQWPPQGQTCTPALLSGLCGDCESASLAMQAVLLQSRRRSE